VAIAGQLGRRAATAALLPHDFEAADLQQATLKRLTGTAVYWRKIAMCGLAYMERLSCAQI
jgi:hypothetical protein